MLDVISSPSKLRALVEGVARRGVRLWGVLMGESLLVEALAEGRLPMGARRPLQGLPDVEGRLVQR